MRRSLVATTPPKQRSAEPSPTGPRVRTAFDPRDRQGLNTTFSDRTRRDPTELPRGKKSTEEPPNRASGGPHTVGQPTPLTTGQWPIRWFWLTLHH